jgi:hypothetical protein
MRVPGLDFCDAITASAIAVGQDFVSYSSPREGGQVFFRSREDFLAEITPGVPRFELTQSEDDRNFDLARFWAASPDLATFAMAAHTLREYVKERFSGWPEENQYLEYLAALKIVGMDVPNISEKLLRGAWEVDDDSD